MEIPAKTRGGYRLAQLDDHALRLRRNFPWRPPLVMSLQARVSATALPGTWGFGFWNHPFSFVLGLDGIAPRLPALPQAAWFFHASPQNYLSFRDDLPANGFLTATFSPERVAPAAVVLSSPLLALTLIPGAAQKVRQLLRRLVHQDAAQIDTTVTEWHAYRLEWGIGHARFSLDGTDILHTDVAPAGPLSLVIWVDNQYAALPPTGSLGYGVLPNPQPAWLEIKELSIQ